jgi:hypothetical protein
MNLVSRVAIWTLVGSLGMAAPAVADSVLCAKEKNGKLKGGIKVREGECKNKEVEIDLGDFGLDALRADFEAELAGLSAAIEAEKAQRIAEIEAMTELLAVQQNHAEETSSVNDFAETSFTPLVELGTVAPHAGYLMVWANLNAEYDITSEGDANVDLECRIAVDGVASSIVVDQEFAKVAGGTNSGESVAVATVVPVDAGDRSAALECRKTGGGLVFVKSRSLTTLFVTLEGEAPSILPTPLPLPGPLPLSSLKAGSSLELNE